MTNNPAKERVIVELNELAQKYKKLYNFIGTKEFYDLSHIMKTLLRIQLIIMNNYKVILKERIDNWEIKDG